MDAITREEARMLIRHVGLSERLVQHAEGVARRGESVCRLLESSGHTVHAEKVIIASLVHDIGLSRPHGLDHGETSAEVLEEFGLNNLADLVREHVFPKSSHLSLEAKILIYCNLTTGPDGEAIDAKTKLDFLHQLAYNWKNEYERTRALNALQIKRKIISEIEALIESAIVNR
ncbi:HD domain-containing protein [candidate division WOR-3 bacterium]|nr:HD domain-containing protein [candidate division WOR-3 bacterium]